MLHAQPSLFAIDGDETDAPASHDSNTAALSQYFTPRWAAALLVQQFFGELSPEHHVLEPSCGDGSFLRALPNDITATGVEIDPLVASVAATDTGRRIIVGDFATVDIDFQPTHIIGNPPFSSSVIMQFTKRAKSLLPPGGHVGWIIPAWALSFASTTLDMMRGFDCEVSLIPRDLYPRIAHPLVFARLTKNNESRLVGFALYPESLAVRHMRTLYRRILESGRKPIWQDVLTSALRACGGEASLGQIYRVVEGFQPTTTPFWRDILRREAGEHCERVAPGVFRLREPAIA